MCKMVAEKRRKIYYTMGEVTEMFDVKPSLIRFWEKRFDILKPHKNNKGNRLFTPEDVDNLKIIYHLVKERGMTLDGAARRLKAGTKGVRRDMELMERLQSIRGVLLGIRQELKEPGDIFDEADMPHGPSVSENDVEVWAQDSSAGDIPDGVDVVATDRNEDHSGIQAVPGIAPVAECDDEGNPVADTPLARPYAVEQTLF